MTKKQFETLKQYELTLSEARANYYRALMSDDVSVISRLYEELGYKLENKNCARCILGMLLNLAKEYDNYIAKTTKTTKTKTDKQ